MRMQPKSHGYTVFFVVVLFSLGTCWSFAAAVPGGYQHVAQAECDGSARNCCVTARCCSATAGDCGQGNACSCKSTCGEGIGICSCQCTTGSSSESHDPAQDQAPARDLLTLDITRSGGIAFDEIIDKLRVHTGWTYSLPSEASTVYLKGKFRGTVKEVHAALARDTGYDLSVDSINKAATFQIRR